MTTCTNVGTLVMETPGGHAVSSFSGLNSRSALATDATTRRASATAPASASVAAPLERAQTSTDPSAPAAIASPAPGSDASSEGNAGARFASCEQTERAARRVSLDAQPSPRASITSASADVDVDVAIAFPRYDDDGC